jgi:hypothetical protein
MAIITFGKWEGAPLREVAEKETAYFRWMLKARKFFRDNEKEVDDLEKEMHVHH